MLLDLLFHHEQGWWNTAHGTSPKNLKFIPNRDGYVVKTTTTLSSGSLHSVPCFASAATSLQAVGVSAGCSGFTRGEANAFARAQSCGDYISVKSVPAYGYACSSAYSVGCGADGCGSSVSAGATVFLGETWAEVGGAESYQGSGVKNPSDEEVAIMVYLLSKKRLTRRSNYDYNQGR